MRGASAGGSSGCARAITTEIANREIERRTRATTLFPNEASCLRLFKAAAMEISKDEPIEWCYLKTGEDDSE